MLLKPKQTKYRKYHKGRISYNIRTNQDWKDRPVPLSRRQDEALIGRGEANQQSDQPRPRGSSGPFHPETGHHHVENEGGYQYGLMALEPGRITASNIYAIELAIKRKLKSDSSQLISTPGATGFEIRMFPHLPVTKKPIETRMGKGKGNIDYWMTRVKAGAILLEFNCSNENFGKVIGKVLNSKLPIKTKFISRVASNPIL